MQYLITKEWLKSEESYSRKLDLDWFNDNYPDGGDHKEVYLALENVDKQCGYWLLGHIGKTEFAIKVAMEVYKEDSFTVWANNWLNYIDRTELSAATAKARAKADAKKLSVAVNKAVEETEETGEETLEGVLAGAVQRAARAGQLAAEAAERAARAESSEGGSAELSVIYVMETKEELVWVERAVKWTAEELAKEAAWIADYSARMIRVDEFEIEAEAEDSAEYKRFLDVLDTCLRGSDYAKI
jgi:hypothetical protein